MKTQKLVSQYIRSTQFFQWLRDSPTALPLATSSKGRWIGAFAAVGGLIGLLVTFALGTPKAYILDFVLNFLIAVIGVLTFRLAETVSRLWINATVTISTIIITLEIATGSGMDPSSMATVFYVWVALFCFAFLSTYESLAQITFAIICYSLAEIYGDRPSAPVADWILTVSTIIVASVSSGYLNYTIRKLAITDSLTGISNRKGWELAVTREIARAKRIEHLVVVGIIDLDNFKEINDNFGHTVGDQVLRDTASALKNALRPFDVVARWGGDEFVFMTLISEASYADGLLKRITSAVQSVTDHRCGAVVSRPIMDIVRLVSHADKILYDAKDHPDRSFLIDVLIP